MLGIVRLPIQRQEAGILRAIIGATVSVYNTNANGTAPIDIAGNLIGTPILSTIYSDRAGTLTQANPLVSDSRGMIEFYAPAGIYHFLVQTIDGQIYGIPWHPAYGDPAQVGDTSINVKLRPSIQIAHDEIKNTGGRLYIPTGSYDLPDTVRTVKDKPIEIFGDGEGLSFLNMNAAQKDLNHIELKGDFSTAEKFSIVGGGVSGKGRGIQLGRALIDSTSSVCLGYRVKRIRAISIPSYGIGFYGNNSTDESIENTVDTNVDAFSLTIDSIIEQCRIDPTISKGGIYAGQGCTTITHRKCLIGAAAGGAAIRHKGVESSLIEDCIIEGVDQNYIQIASCGRVTVIRPYCEMDPAVVPTKYFIDISNSSGTIIFGPRFFRHLGTTGVCLFIKCDANSQSTDIYSPSAEMGVNSTGDSITTGNPANVNVLGFKKIKQPSGYVDMVVT